MATGQRPRLVEDGALLGHLEEEVKDAAALHLANVELALRVVVAQQVLQGAQDQVERRRAVVGRVALPMAPRLERQAEEARIDDDGLRPDGDAHVSGSRAGHRQDGAGAAGVEQDGGRAPSGAAPRRGQHVFQHDDAVMGVEEFGLLGVAAQPLQQHVQRLGLHGVVARLDGDDVAQQEQQHLRRIFVVNLLLTFS